VTLVVDSSVANGFGWPGHTRLDLLEASDTRDWRVVCGALKELKSAPDVILSFSHHFCAVAARSAAELGVTAFDPAALELAADKRRVRDAVAGSTTAVPYWTITADEDLNEAATHIAFPAVVKPVAETSSTDVSLATDTDALKRAATQIRGVRHNRKGFSRNGEVLVEQYVDGPEFSVETMTLGGATTFYGVTVKSPLTAHPFIEQADSFPCMDGAVVELLEAGALDILSRMPSFSGPAHLEMRLTKEGPKLIELNPRQPGGFVPDLVHVTTGRDIFLDTICGLLGVDSPHPEAAVPAATWWQIYPERAGRVIRCHVPDQVRAAEEVLHVGLNVAPGDVLFPPRDNHGRIGDLVVSGENAAASLLQAQRLSRTIEIALSI
jgi:biotin carboxylase